MENFVVSARKYRPVTFDSVVGQHSITSTLKNAIKTNHLAQAFLFCGPRGVGKTTCARILAKTINCFSITENIEACDECESCKSFNDGHSLNIYELDAASNNSVDDIRNLIEQVRFAPQLGTHKVYIIDEVHMLSPAAFNAFLKTLEEPPKHAIFILATTEKHKIIPTILSRCQIFDFNRIQIDDIASHLKSIAEKEKINAEDDALHIVSQKADGALRDALSIFDQIVSFSGNNITYQNVIDNLNILDYDYYFKLTDAILSKNISSCLLIFNEILNKGFDGHNFINGLAEHFRNLLVCQDSETISLLEVGENIKEKYKEQATKANTNLYVEFLNITSKADISYKSSKNHRLLVEIMLMQLCSTGSDTEKKKSIINLPFSSKKEKKISANVSQPITQTESISVKSTTNYTQKQSLTIEQVEEPKKSFSTSENSNTKPSVSLKASASFSFSESISIKKTNEEQAKKNQEIEEDLSKKPIQEFTQEEFSRKWFEYKKKMETEGKLSLASIFEETPLINGNLIELTMENKALDEEFNANRTEVLDFLRKKLNNYNINITTTINKDTQTKKAYTPQEKFMKMSEKNPHLIDLAKLLDADVGYPID